MPWSFAEAQGFFPLRLSPLTSVSDLTHFPFEGIASVAGCLLSNMVIRLCDKENEYTAVVDSSMCSYCSSSEAEVIPDVMIFYCVSYHLCELCGIYALLLYGEL